MPNQYSTPASRKTVVRVKKKMKTRHKKDTGVGRRLSPEKRAEIRDKQNQALELRMAGTTYRDIAAGLGYKSPSAAKYAVERAIARTETDAAKEVVAMDLALVEEMMMRCVHALRTDGALGQISQITHLMQWRYRLLGISDETVRALQSEHGIATVTNNTNNVMVVQAAPETEEEFISKMMRSVGVDPNSDDAKKLLEQHKQQTARTMPMLEGSANDAEQVPAGKKIDGAEIVDAEIVE